MQVIELTTHNPCIDSIEVVVRERARKFEGNQRSISAFDTGCNLSNKTIIKRLQALSM